MDTYTHTELHKKHKRQDRMILWGCALAVVIAYLIDLWRLYE